VTIGETKKRNRFRWRLVFDILVLVALVFLLSGRAFGQEASKTGPEASKTGPNALTVDDKNAIQSLQLETYRTLIEAKDQLIVSLEAQVLSNKHFKRFESLNNSLAQWGDVMKAKYGADAEWELTEALVWRKKEVKPLMARVAVDKSTPEARKP
jgi:hypothetical protein